MNSLVEVWQRVMEYRGNQFLQKSGKAFTYKISGDALKPSTTNYLVPKSQFEKAWDRLPLNGPGEINDLIAPSYLYALLTDHRIINPNGVLR